MTSLLSPVRYLATLGGACVLTGLSFMLILQAPASVATEEEPVIARFQQAERSNTMRFQPSDFDISRTVPVRVRATGPSEVSSLPAAGSTEEATTDEPGTAALLVADGVNLRSGPSVNSRRLEVLGSGLAVRVLETERSWSRIVTEDGRSGWLASKFLSL